MKVSIRLRFNHPCMRFSKSSCANGQINNNDIHQTFSKNSYQTVFLANKSRITFYPKKYSTFGLAHQYEEGEPTEEHGPVWQVIEKREQDDSKNEKPSHPPDSSPQQPLRKQNTVTVASLVEEDNKNVDKELSHSVVSPVDVDSALVAQSEQQKRRAQIKWTSQINKLIQLQQFPQAQKMIDQALSSNFPLNVINFNTIAKCYSRLNRVDKLHNIVQEMKRRGLHPDEITFNILIDTFGKRKDLRQMTHLFAKMLEEGVQPTISTFTSMMHSYFKCDRPREALVLFNQMPDYKIQPNQNCCMLVLRILAKNNDFEQLTAVVKLFEDSHWKMDSSGIFCIIEAYEQVGDMETCLKFFNKRHHLLQFTDLGLWTRMLQILANHATMDLFYKYYTTARAELPRCDSVFYTAIMGALLKREQLQMFWKIAEDLNRDTEVGVQQQTWWSVSLMDVYMRGCIKSQRFEEVPTILKRMQQFNLKPDLDMLSGMASTGCESLEGQDFNNFVRLYARVAAAYLRYKSEQENYSTK